jgi:hypothetical protein
MWLFTIYYFIFSIVFAAPPVIVYSNNSQEVAEGSQFTLVCIVNDTSGQRNVTWHKVGGGKVSSTNIYNKASINRADAGSYECRAHNGNECAAKSAKTNITVTCKFFKYCNWHSSYHETLADLVIRVKLSLTFRHIDQSHYITLV